MTGLNASMTGKKLWGSARNRLIKTFFAIIDWFKPAYTLTEQVGGRDHKNPSSEGKSGGA